MTEPVSHAERKRRNDGEVFYASLAPGEALARVQAIAAANDAQCKNKRGNNGHIPRKSLKYELTPTMDSAARRLKQARLAADALILRRGGTVPYTPSYEEYEAEYRAAMTPQTETA